MILALGLHSGKCLPATPCASCRAMELLRNRLSSEDLAAFKELLAEAEAGRLPIDTPLEELGLSNRALMPLKRHGYHTIKDVLPVTDDYFKYNVPVFGKKCLKELDAALEKARWKRSPVPA